MHLPNAISMSRLSKVTALQIDTDICDLTHYHAAFAGGKK